MMGSDVMRMPGVVNNPVQMLGRMVSACVLTFVCRRMMRFRRQMPGMSRMVCLVMGLVRVPRCMMGPSCSKTRHSTDRTCK